MLRKIAVASISCLSLSAGAASAASLSVHGDFVGVEVRYGPVDLRTLQGAKALAVRIRRAAASACGGDDPAAHIGERFARCREQAIERAVRELGSPLLADALGRDSLPPALRR
jgi:UrcA family protein